MLFMVSSRIYYLFILISLIQLLFLAADKYPNIRLNFNQKLVHAKLDDGELEFIK